MSNIAVKAENLSKAYQLGDVGTGTISRDLERWYAQIRGKEDPLLRIGEANNQNIKGKSDIVWSLRDVNFEIEQGEAVGIIGRNGAGKSTLLKILSKVTSPTIGKISGKGRIASLLEVGTGFHPELSGRENIFLNGAILGMRKYEIKRKFDEIVEFAGIERYIDTPVKRYSSGMYVRLAFAVAAHLESEILIVDEVLAVGDAEFQKKCLGKMGEVSKGEGRTVLFVSHNMASVKQLCNTGFLLANGELQARGNISEICNLYQHSYANSINRYYLGDDSKNFIGDYCVRLKELKIIDEQMNEISVIHVTTVIGFYIVYEIINSDQKPDLSFLLSTINEEKVFHVVKQTDDYSVGLHKWIVWIPKNLLNDLSYVFMLGITTSNPLHIHLQYEIAFEVLEDFESETRKNNYTDRFHGVVRPNLTWTKL